MTMGERIRYLRESINLTQEELGDLLGVQKSAIAKYENGKVENIKRSTIKKMSIIFNKPASYLMGFDENESEDKLKEMIQDLYGENAVNLLSIFAGLNEIGQKKALSALEDISELPKYRKDVIT